MLAPYQFGEKKKEKKRRRKRREKEKKKEEVTKMLSNSLKPIFWLVFAVRRGSTGKIFPKPAIFPSQKSIYPLPAPTNQASEEMTKQPVLPCNNAIVNKHYGPLILILRVQKGCSNPYYRKRKPRPIWLSVARQFSGSGRCTIS